MPDLIPIITNAADLEAFCGRMGKEAYITLDTEFMRRTTYYPVLCLVQIAGESEAAIIDPIAAPEMPMAPLFDLLRDETVLKVLHSGRQDIEIFYHLDGCIPQPLFDTQIAAMVCGFGEQVSYEKLVQQLAKAPLDKTQRFTDWSRRPLTEKQLRYALGDVTHLRTVYASMKSRVEKDDRQGWIAAEMTVLANPSTYENPPEEAWKRLRPRSKEPVFLNTLQALAAWREREAMARNLVRGRLLKDEALLDIAASRPASRPELEKIRGVHGALNRGDQEAVLAVIAETQDAPPPKPLAPAGKIERPLTDAQEVIYDILRLLLKARCHEAHVAPRLVADSTMLKELAQMARHDELPDLPVFHGWRHAVFGEDARRLLRGELSLRVTHGKPVFETAPA